MCGTGTAGYTTCGIRVQLNGVVVGETSECMKGTSGDPFIHHDPLPGVTLSGIVHPPWVQVPPAVRSTPHTFMQKFLEDWPPGPLREGS